jgi:predicted TIM-barrel fold metal-dependent hydrolase
MIIDSHTHVISSDEERYPLRPLGLDQGTGSERRPAAWYRDLPISAERLLELMQGSAVSRALLVQAVGAYGFDNAYCVDAAGAHRDRLSSVCAVDVAGDPDPAETLRAWAKRGARGVRLFTVTTPEGQWLDEPIAEPVWRCAAELGMPVVVTLLARQIPRLANALRRHRDVQVALDHCGFPDVRGGAPYPRLDALLALAEHDNLRLKVTSHVLGQALRDHGDPGSLVQHLARRFGASRLMWGSDYPQTHFRDYPGLVELGVRAADGLSARDRDAFLCGTAVELWPELA